MKKIVCIMLIFALALSFGACFAPEEPVVTEPEEPPIEQGYEIGKLCYGAELPVIDGNGETGQTVNPATTGKVTVINFWGVWCNPCVSELPHFEAVAKDYADTVAVIAIHSAGDRRHTPKFLSENYPDSSIIFAWETSEDYNGDYYKQLGAYGSYPYTLILNAQGVVASRHDGMMSHEELVTYVEDALAQS